MSSPDTILRLATAYWDSRCLLAAVRVGVFESLADGPRSADAVAATLQLAPRPTRLLLNACVGLGLLAADEAGYRNTPEAQTFLVRRGPAFLGDALGYAAQMWDAWGRLEEALASGTPPVSPESYTGGDPERTRTFVHGMHRRALALGQGLVAVLDLAGRRRLLDVGGGPGTYAALLTRRWPGLEATLLDLPGVVAAAREILDSMEAGAAVAVLAGDYHTTPFPPGHDVILMSGIFHRESPDTCRDLIARAHAALAPGGLLAIGDVFADAGGATPAFAALFGLNMMLSAPDGGVHADADVATWLRDAGFSRVESRPVPPPLPHRVVTGVR